MPETASPLSDLSGLSLAEIAQAVADRRLPPVAAWHPRHCGHSGMRIARDGTWYHDGDPIRRPAMVRLFAGLLRRESNGAYVLVTPVEKLDIDVEDTPFVAVEARSEGSAAQRRIAFRLNTEEPVIAGPDHPIFVTGDRPYVRVRDGLDAAIARPVYYELADIALDEGTEPVGLWSDGCFFPLAPA